MDAPDEEPRRAQAPDHEPLAALVDAAFATYLTRLDRPPAPMLEDLRPLIAAGEVWVVGRPPQGLICLRGSAEGLLIRTLAVHPEDQGTGRGRRLMEFAEAEARRAGMDRVWLYTNEAMHENIALYRHLGYREFDRRREDGYRRVFMEKDVSPS